MCSLSGSFPAKTLLTQVTAKESQVGGMGHGRSSAAVQ